MLRPLLRRFYHVTMSRSSIAAPTAPQYKIKDPLLVVLGSTGTGKSQLAIDLACAYNGEIINVDAMQMYDGLPILTNKVTEEEKKGIPHHLLGTISLSEEPWRVDVFVKEASRIIKEIRARGRMPVLVGGSHYYTQSLLFPDSLVTKEGLNEKDTAVDLDAEISDGSADEGEQKFAILDEPTDVILAKLKEVDPIMAGRWHPNDRRKIQRSLQLYLETGRRASDIYQAQQEQKRQRLAKAAMGEDEGLKQLQSSLLFWVHADAPVLKERLDSRVYKMVDAGLLAEVESLAEFLHEQEQRGIQVDKSSGIWVSIGWKEFEPYLRALRSGTASQEELDKLKEEAINKTQVATRTYAKNQVRWIRIKLINALKDTQSLERLYLLDGSDLQTWNANVSETAIRITDDFLAGRELPAPSTICPQAAEQLIPKKSFIMGERRDLWVARHCENCNQTIMTEEEWKKHLKSRRHRLAVKGAEKAEAKRKYFESLKAGSSEKKPDGELDDKPNIKDTAADEANGSDRSSQQ